MAVEIDKSAIEILAQLDKIHPLAKELAKSIDEESFPGAILPAIQINGDVVIYALASDRPTWRRLHPLLFAFVGPTITDFEGIPIALNKKEPIEKYFAKCNLHAIAILRPGTFNKAELVAFKALASLQKAMSRAPNLAVFTSEPTSLMLARLQDALNGGDFSTAWKTYSILQDELRLDSQNLLNLEFQIHAKAGDWTKIRNHKSFELACAGKPASATAEVLLETLYWSHFQEEEGHRSPFYEEDVIILCRNLLFCIDQTTSPIAEKLNGFLAVEREENELVDSLDKPATPSKAYDLEFVEQWDTVDPLDHAKSTLLAFANSTDQDTYYSTMAKAAYDSLREEERSKLLSSPRFKEIWSQIQIYLASGLPQIDWIQWLTRLEDPEFDFSKYARIASEECRLSDKALDTQFIFDLVSAIEGVPEGVAGDRLYQSLPYLVHWVGSDPQWPRISLRPFYLTLLTRIAFATRQGEETIKSVALLIEGAFRCGLSKAEYRDVMDLIAVITSNAFNKHTAYDIFEFFEIASDFRSIDESAFNSATVTVGNEAQGHLDRLTEGQRLAYLNLANRIGWTINSEIPDSACDGTIVSALSNKSVGIYTLTESAGRQARNVLESLVPGIRVELNHDREATAALRALVSRVDLFVVAWASAKHAATNFIKSRRGSKPLIYAAGKGASSLIRAVEDYYATTT